MPRNGGQRAGSALQKQGTWRFAATLLQGFDYDGGHPESHGISADGEVVEIPEHRHKVSIDLSHLEFYFGYTVGPNWGLQLTGAWEVKEQFAQIEFEPGYDEDARESASRNGEIHHRNETYSGLSDFFLEALYLKRDVLSPRDELVLGIGVGLPLGETEGDPFAAGRNGEEHLHLQFGSGTYDPLAQVQYSLSFARKMGFSLYVAGKYPVYENKKGHRSSSEVSYDLQLVRRLTPKFQIFVSGSGMLQGYGRWQGQRDENSGTRVHRLAVGTNYRTKRGLNFWLTYARPYIQETLAKDGGAFEQGTSLNVGFSRVM